MILQLKISLKDVGMPVWRRIQIREESTFRQLHEVIQIAFDWTDSHLHNFYVHRTNGDTSEPAFIEMKEVVEDDTSFPSPSFFARALPKKLNEEEERLSDWLKQEKDRIIYTYDFGDDWEHEIVLEKRLEPSPSAVYPVCIKAKNDTPFEDSRFEIMEDSSFLSNPHWKEIVADINQELQYLQK